MHIKKFTIALTLLLVTAQSLAAGSRLLYLAPDEDTQSQLFSITGRKNPAARWGGFHVTVGGTLKEGNHFSTEAIVDKLNAEGSQEHWTLGERKISIKDRRFITAHFRSSTLNRAKKILIDEGWARRTITGRWHVTLGEAGTLSSSQIEQMLALLRNATWHWVAVTQEEPSAQGISWTHHQPAFSIR